MLLRCGVQIILAVFVTNPVYAVTTAQGEQQSVDAFQLGVILPPSLESLIKEGKTISTAPADDPDGCCVQSNGTGIACSTGIKKKQCFDDCDQTPPCTAKWHAGYCNLDDHCGGKPTQQP